ncbi:MAG: transporter [bacterium]
MWLINWLKGVLLFCVISLLWIRPEPVVAGGLKDFVADLYGGDGILLGATPPPFPSHAPHFAASSLGGLDSLSAELASNVGQLTFGSTVTGFTFDIERGVPVRTTETLGPLVAERGPTLGAGRLNVAFSYTRLDYKKFDGDDLDDLSLIFSHDDVNGDGVLGPPLDFELDEINVDVDIEITQDVFSIFATYGLTRTLDVGFVVPIVHIDVRAKALATIVRNSASSPFVHNFDPATGDSCIDFDPARPDQCKDESGGDATGIGDVLLRTKYNFLRNQEGWPDLAIFGQVKLPTGDKDDLLGTGETNFLALLVATKSFGLGSDIRWLEPHLNFGYELSTDSDQDNLRYIAGLDARVHPRLTTAIDVLGRWEPNGDPIGNNLVDFAFGVKWNPFRTLVLNGNVLLPVNKDEGLRTDVIWTVGVEYTF